MADDFKPDERKAEAVREQAERRRVRQDEEDPSGHGMQVTPRQQQHVAETSDESAGVAADIDENALADLKGDNRP